MNKRDARKAVFSGEYTWGQLRTFVEAAEERGGQSTLNPQFTLAETCAMYRGGLDKHEDSETANDSSNMSFMVAVNILRDCN